MRFSVKAAWSYAALLVLLFSIAALAVFQSLNYIGSKVSPAEYRVVVFLILAITFGLMLISGAFGIWTIRFASAAEARRRVGRFVDAMDYLNDGVLAVDHRGLIRGSNPAARALAATEIGTPTEMARAYPCLSDDDVVQLMNRHIPEEIEHTMENGHHNRVLRFRSQPSEDLQLVMVSDVTGLSARRSYHRQLARLQLIGQIAQGVANDFNRLLCAISGHVELLERGRLGPDETKGSLQAIAQGAERGISLAAHLLKLSESSTLTPYTSMVTEHARAAVTALRDVLPPEWTVDLGTRRVAPAAIGGIQLEQVILNLALLGAEQIVEPGVCRVLVASPCEEHLLDVGNRFAAVVLIHVLAEGEADEPTLSEVVTPGSSGLIESVIRSILAEGGGVLDVMHTNRGSPVFRIALPRPDVVSDVSTASALPDDLVAYVTRWNVALSTATRHYEGLEDLLCNLGVQVTRLDNVVSTLAFLENTRNIDALVIQDHQLRPEIAGLLRAIMKLCPGTGIVVTCEDIDAMPDDLRNSVVFAPANSDANRLVLAMVEAQGLAAGRER